MTHLPKNRWKLARDNEHVECWNVSLSLCLFFRFFSLYLFIYDMCMRTHFKLIKAIIITSQCILDGYCSLSVSLASSKSIVYVCVCVLSICWKPEHIILQYCCSFCALYTPFFSSNRHNFSIKLNQSRISFDFKWLLKYRQAHTHTHT